MSELIDRQALLDSVYRNLPMIPSMAGMTAEEMRLRIAALIENAPTASAWHRVEDGLPEIGKRVLVSYGGYVQILKRTDSMTYDGKNYWWNEADGLWERVEEGSYWMPIEPPKEDA